MINKSMIDAVKYLDRWATQHAARRPETWKVIYVTAHTAAVNSSIFAALRTDIITQIAPVAAAEKGVAKRCDAEKVEKAAADKPLPALDMRSDSFDELAKLADDAFGNVAKPTDHATPHTPSDAPILSPAVANAALEPDSEPAVLTPKQVDPQVDPQAAVQAPVYVQPLPLAPAPLIPPPPAPIHVDPL